MHQARSNHIFNMISACVLFTLCFVSVLTVPVEDLSGRIAGGNVVTQDGSFGFQAYMILTTSSGNFYCSGAILSSKCIVTAAQCIVGARNATVLVGSNSLTAADSNRRILTATRFVPHQKYDRQQLLANNIGLVFLDQILEFTSTIRPIAISKTNAPVKVAFTVSGWGTTKSESNQGSPDLRYKSVVTISNSECAQTYGGAVLIDDVICSSSGICAGDSGAPMVVNPSSSSQAQLIGLGIFYSIRKCDENIPAGFTNVSYFADWIDVNAAI